MLTEEGYEIVGQAGDGEAAVALTTELKPDLVVMDVKMPKMDGITAAEQIATQRIAPVVMLTAFSQRDLIERIMPSVLETQRHGHQDVNAAVVEHTKQTASRLMEQSRVIADAVSNGEVAVVGVFYHLEDGEAELVHGHGTWLPGR